MIFSLRELIGPNYRARRIFRGFVAYAAVAFCTRSTDAGQQRLSL